MVRLTLVSLKLVGYMLVGQDTYRLKMIIILEVSTLKAVYGKLLIFSGLWEF